MEDDGDGAVGESFRQRTERGEGLGREDGAFEGTIGVADAGLESADEDGAQLGIARAGAGADGAWGFVEEEGRKLIGVRVNAMDEGGGGDAGW
ncbi:MAG TPA: hypothetical protein VJA94_06600 [Candidatus Angelobacter sp.]